MIHPHTQLAVVSERIGFGVVATQFIPAGTIVWVRDALDRRIPREEAEQLGPLYQRALRHYTFWEEVEGDLILCWDHARYVNHSCDANCLGGGFEFEIAIRDIQPGEELTDDYGTFGYASELDCACGSPHCRGRIRRDDVRLMGPVWDGRLLAALTRLPAVQQPLWPIVADKAAVAGVLAHPEALPRHRAA